MKKLPHILKSFLQYLLSSKFIIISECILVLNNYSFRGCKCLHVGHLALVNHLIIVDTRKQATDNQTRLADVTNKVSEFFMQLRTGIYKLIKYKCMQFVIDKNECFF